MSMVPGRTLKQDLAWGLLLIAVLIAAITSLTHYPDPFDDEGLYAAFGHNFVKTGIIQAPELTSAVPFDKSDGTCNREMPALFGLAGKVAGYSLATARAIALLHVLLATAIFFFIARSLGISGWLGALLFASTERVYYAAHVFRPEAAMVLVNTALVYLLVRSYRHREQPDKISFLRGLLNAPLVMAHGNGLTSALINSAEILTKRLQGSKRFLRTIAVYFVGSCAAILIFYLTHVRDIGWAKFFEQLTLGNSQAQFGGGIWDTISRDIMVRWGRELVIVGTSTTAKFLRFYFYGVILITAIWSVISFPGVARRMGLLTLACFWAYVFVVQDKIDIHIAEMIPYFMASVVAWYVAARKAPKLAKWVPQAALGGILLVGLALGAHHTIKYRGPTIAERIGMPAVAFRRSQSIRTDYATVVGKMEYWFMFRDTPHFYSLRYLDEHLPLHGGVIAIGPKTLYRKLNVCKVDYVDPNDYFTAYSCPE